MTQAEGPRLAIIGCEDVVAHHLLPSLLRIGWLPTVLVDRSRARCEKLLPQFGPRASVTIVSDWVEADGKFDAAIVATPSAARGTIGNALAGRGIHLLVEKPLASTLAQAEQMVATADAQGAVLAVGLLRRHLMIARWTKALLVSGILGRIERFEACEGFVYNWAVNSPDTLCPGTTGGRVAEIGAHVLDLLLWWFGEVRKVTCRGDFRLGAEAGCRLDLVMESGAVGAFDLGRSRKLRNTVRIVGSEGHVEVHLYTNNVISASTKVLSFVHEGASPRTMRPQIFPDLFDAELRDFREAAVKRSAPAVGGRESLRSLALIERCFTNYGPLALPWVARPPRLGPSAIRGRPGEAPGACGFIGGRSGEQPDRNDGAAGRCTSRSLA
ncbi:oxidoreductase, NAD-binding domain protein [Acetobacteraceae bacterium AT-5844]|nr:oxidoreductase, NAD-binding domain protein [Acetobacteraceae bacterium AT-5844]